MQSCAACAHENPAGSRYCGYCGSALVDICPVCALEVDSRQPVCGACGALLTVRERPANAALVARVDLPPYTPTALVRQVLRNREALRGEWKHVTVLFCDLVESTRLAASIGAEEMHEFLSSFFTLALDQVHRYEGTINQFLGDGFMAIFGAPVAFEDHAIRAALAAIAVVDSVGAARGARSERGWRDAHVRLGLNSGPVVVGVLGNELRMDYTAAGDTTHLAARLQTYAGPGEILCGEATVRAAHGALQVTARAPLQLKGVTTPVLPFRLDGVDATAARRPGDTGRFVGRETQLRMLDTLLATAAAGRGHVVEIAGEPGVGKSRLLREFVARLAPNIRVIVAQCISYGHQRPDVPLVDIAGALCDSDGAVLALNIGHDLLDCLAALRGDRMAIARMSSLDPATVRGRTRQALVRSLQWLSQRSPLVVVIEDLHWADPSSLDYLAAIAAGVAGWRCLIVMSARPGGALAWPTGAARDRCELSPLAADEAGRLFDQQPDARVLSNQQRVQILTRAEGNPFFLEELVRSAASGAAVPGDVFDVLAARVDRLDAADKEVIRTAAILGRDFDVDVLAMLLCRPTGVREALTRLATQGFVEPCDADRARFVHALTHEVVYAGMLGSARRHLHGQVAATLESRALDPDEAAEELARHHAASDDPQAALPFLERVVARAIRRHTLETGYAAVVDAVRLYGEGDGPVERDMRCIGVLLQAFPIFHFLHRHREYAALLEARLATAERLQMPALLGPFLAQLGHRRWVEGRYPEAEKTLLRGSEICEAAGDLANAAHADFMLSWLYANLARYEESEMRGLRALRHLDRVPFPLFEVFACLGLLLAAIYRGRFADATNWAQRARCAAERGRDDGMAAFADAFLAFVHYERGDDPAAIAAGRRGLAGAPTRYFEGWAATFMAAAMVRTGGGSSALETLSQAVRYADDAGHLSGYCLVALLEAEAMVREGHLAKAAHAATELRARALAMPYPYVAGGALLVTAECALQRGAREEAASVFALAERELGAIGAEHRARQARDGSARCR